MKTIILCGFMGCGKTTVGRILAESLGADFYDLDEYIVNAEKMTIPEIFEKFGESHFRCLEEKYIKEISNTFSIIATGGGSVINKNTSDAAKEKGTIIFLDVSFEVCFDRIKNDQNRPIAALKTKEELRLLYNARRKIYSDVSEFTVTAGRTPSLTAKKIINILKKQKN